MNRRANCLTLYGVTLDAASRRTAHLVTAGVYEQTAGLVRRFPSPSQAHLNPQLSRPLRIPHKAASDTPALSRPGVDGGTLPPQARPRQAAQPAPQRSACPFRPRHSWGQIRSGVRNPACSSRPARSRRNPAFARLPTRESLRAITLVALQRAGPWERSAACRGGGEPPDQVSRRGGRGCVAFLLFVVEPIDTVQI